MNKKQLCDHIGNIDDRLIEQAGHIPNYRRQHRRKVIQRLAAMTAVTALMVCSFSAGAMAFAKENVVKVLVEPEFVSLEEIGLTMILPDSWKGEYAVEKNGRNFIIYSNKIRDGSVRSDAFDGILFYIVCYDTAMTPEQFVENGYDFTGYRYLFATKSNTYILHYASDVQWDPSDPEQKKIYTQMASEIENIRFIPDNALLD